jgi:hypothetical protein
MATRLPRPISVFLIITSTAEFLSMDSKRCIGCADTVASLPPGRGSQGRKSWGSVLFRHRVSSAAGS